MSKCIDADALQAQLERKKAGVANQRYTEGWNDCMMCVKSMVSKAPIVDAMPVMHYKDCKNWKPTESKAGNSFSDMEYIGGCEFTKYCHRESDFCSYGERKDGDGNG